MQSPVRTYDMNWLRDLNILIADDDALNTKLLSILFAQSGMRLQTAKTGAEAVQMMREDKFDIVLMDIEMPIMNGYEATTTIRDELKNNIPIIAMTAHDTPEEKEKCMRLGMNGHLAKPVDTELLFTSIYELTLALSTYVEKKTGNDHSPDPVKNNRLCDLSYLNNATGGNKEIISNIVDIFLQQSAEELLALGKAIEKTNYPIIRDIAHKIRSSFLLMGISAVDNEFQEMEQLGNLSSGIQKIRLLNLRINNVFSEARTEIESLMLL